MKATLFDRRHRREALTGGDQPWPWCVPPPGGGSVWPCSRCVDTSVQMRGQRGPRLRIPDWKRLVAGTLSYPQTETGPYQILVMSYVRTQPMRGAGSKRTDSGRPHIATYVRGRGTVTVHGSVCSFCVRLCCGPARCACQRCLVTVHLTR